MSNPELIVYAKIRAVIGRRVRYRGQFATVAKYEPLGAGLCDAMLRFDSGRELWVGLHECKAVGWRLNPLPSRLELIRQAEAARAAVLRQIGKRWRSNG